MVFPLVVLTVAWDRLGPQKTQLGSRKVSFGIGRIRVATTVAGAAAGLMFLVMAGVLAVVAVTGSSLTPAFTASVGARIEDSLAGMVSGLAWIPDPVIGVLLIAVAAGAIYLSARRRRHTASQQQGEPSCHDHHEEAGHEQANIAASPGQ
jgi:hypothetical protein